jgi:hypothetical protein
VWRRRLPPRKRTGAGARKRHLVRRQDHLAGEKISVDGPGATISIYGRDTGEVRVASPYVTLPGESANLSVLTSTKALFFKSEPRFLYTEFSA